MLSNNGGAICRLSKLANSEAEARSKLLIAHARLYVIRRPMLKRVALILMAPFFIFKKLVKQKAMDSSSSKINQLSIAAQIENLPPRARRIYFELKVAIENNARESI